MKLRFLLAALIFFVMLAYFTHPEKREETPRSVVKHDFLFKDFVHGTKIAGSWIDQNYVVNVETGSIRLEMKLTFEFTKDKHSANLNMSPKHGKIHKTNEFSGNSRNGSCTDYETVQPRYSGIAYALNKSYDVTLAMANKALSGITLIAEWIWNKAVWLADMAWFTVRFVVNSFWNGLTIMAEVTWDMITRMVVDVWYGMTTVAEWTWEQGTWVVDKIWNGVTWMGEWICYALKWTGITPTGNLIINAVLEFYHGYLDSHVTYIQARILASTWEDVLYMMSVVLVVNFTVLGIYLFVKVTVNFIRRQWQARKDIIAAANMPPAPKKPIWRPKPKKKNRKNKNKW